MNIDDLLLTTYHHLPGSMRSAVATIHGLRLYQTRYSRSTDRLVTEAIEREQWSTQQWRSWQAERLSMLLERAATHVPYYRDQWLMRRRRGDRASWQYLENWPILGKEPLRETPRAFIADDCRVRDMIHEHTSGTTGKPLSLWLSRETSRAWYALSEVRWRRWYGVGRDDRWGILGGRLVASVQQRRPPFWVWNSAMRQLYMSSYHLAPENIAAYLEAMQHHRITYLLGYASSIYAIAQLGREQRLRAPQLRVVISNAEPLFDAQRALIAEFFQCPVRNTYGMSEIVCGASECDLGTMHHWPESGILEVLAEHDARAVEPGQTGRLVCTGLLNVDMPLIRYDVGDRGALAPAHETCSCGRRLPIILQVEGRRDDVILTRDGRRVGRLDPVFKKDLPIREAQIIQESLNCIRVLVVTAPGYSERDETSIEERLRDRVGDMQITFEYVAQIPRSANGKFRAVICNLTAEERQRAHHYSE